jgi:hypothetical protein
LEPWLWFVESSVQGLETDGKITLPQNFAHSLAPLVYFI